MPNGLSICSTPSDKPLTYHDCDECDRAGYHQCRICDAHLCAEHVVCAGLDDYCFLCAALKAEEENFPISKPSTRIAALLHVLGFRVVSK